MLILLGMVAAGCNATDGIGAPRENPSVRASTTAEQRGLALATTRCAACHAVNGAMSPDKNAPTFETIVNTPGLTAETLRAWLGNSHNFPEMMNFEIAPEHIEDLSAYMLTLRDPGYRPPIQ
ncbi:c-type cytochrome [Sphingobium sp. C100]|uniref:c-type cytochrome n=1 Tax=Sphingobium sp. C100 TaxID=1207055 RepID=UPI001F2A1EC0|nr:c-type cytochrome [Sphingobium sp. C100]